MPLPPPEAELAALRASAGRVRDDLHRLLCRLPSPGELTVRLNRGGAARSGAPLFLHMACTAIARKYAAAGRADVEVQVLALRERRGADRPAHRLRVDFKRIGAHASRVHYGDPDLQLCVASADHLGHAATAWVCQQPDWRYRWTPAGLARLRFMADCWDAYARCGFTEADRAIGLLQFPLSDAFCPPLKPLPCP